MYACVSESPGAAGVIHGVILIGVIFLLPTGAAGVLPGLLRRVATLFRGR